MSKEKPITKKDLQEAIAKEVIVFLDEHRREIIKRARARLNRNRPEKKEA